MKEEFAQFKKLLVSLREKLANPALAKAIADARGAEIAENYIRRVLQLARQGFTEIEFPTYDTNWTSEAYLTVSGQNSNNSVRVPNSFLEAVERDDSWQLVRRTDNRVAKTLPAREVWEQISENYIRRVLQLARQGLTEIEFPTYDTNWTSEAYLTVSGQNSNNSVRVTNAFLEAVERNDSWQLVRRTDHRVARTVPARELWEEIAGAAWSCADPGLQFDTTIRLAHLRQQQPHQRLQPLLRVHSLLH